MLDTLSRPDLAASTNGTHIAYGTATFELRATIPISDAPIRQAVNFDVTVDVAAPTYGNDEFNIKAIVTKLCAEHPLITVDDEVLGEPRIKGTRLAVSIVLTALTEYGGFKEVMAEYDNNYSEKELKAAVKFARDFLDSFYAAP